ncbi:hypothetical protein [Bacillus infantis]|uniref:hypothetical protein n=1 Tax=Bacillus infantis TaxID=324767 RepID=UPI00209E16A1|nr:hypothetical protein [Bacillus infantis]MCP1159313.1 hypothetical protein [Bacillus infantis]
MDDLLRNLIAKNNELESMKKYITDETALNIIKAKQDTLEDVYELVKSSWDKTILSTGD